jgi:vanillate monooxygenase ferredoxin subunit
MKHDLLSVRVVSRKREASDVISFRLASEQGGVPLPVFEAGAHIDVHIADGLARKYSLCNDSLEQDVYEIAVKLEPASRGGSARMHASIQAGDRLMIGTPQNDFSMAQHDGPSVLIAAGIGITPLLSMARSMLRTARLFELHYFARSPDAAAYAPVLKNAPFAEFSQLYFGFDFVSTTARLREIVPQREQRAHLYYCGPRPFMDAVSALADERLCPEQAHREYFSAAQAGSGSDGAFVVELARSQRVFEIPVGKSITDVLFEQQIPLETSCEAGVCGACKTTVLAGVPDHLDSFLSTAERARNDSIMPCVSRCAGGRLVLDL